MRISENFDLKEFTNSSTATKKNIDNNPSAEEIVNLKNLVVKLLQPLRVIYGLPLVVNSGYRSKKLNAVVGGVVNSQHTKGEAADIACDNPSKLIEALKRSELQFDQAILYPTFLHLSLKRNGVNRRMIILKLMLVAFLLTGCAKPIYLQGKTEYVEKSVIKDTTIFVEIEKQVVKAVVEDSSLLETTFSVSMAKVDSLGRLHHTLEQKSKRIEKVVEYRDKIVTIRDSIPYPKIVKEVKEVKKIPNRFWISMVVSIFFIGRLIYKCKTLFTF